MPMQDNLSQLANDATKEEYQVLVNEILDHQYQYFVENAPTIPDSEYDALYKKLKQIEDCHPEWINKLSPSQNAGMLETEVKGSTSNIVKHHPKMMSLDNASTWGDIIAFDQRLKKRLNRTDDLLYQVECKFDGSSVELIFEKGELIQGSTRGNGYEGIDITNNIKLIEDITKTLQTEYPPDFISIRGECILPLSEFERINQDLRDKGEPTYANPRNLVAGTLQQKKAGLLASRKILFFPYSIGTVIESQQSAVLHPCPSNQHDLYNNYFKEFGFIYPGINRLCFLDKVQEFYDEVYSQKASYDFDMDGLVVKVNDHKLYDDIGTTSKAPRYAIAYKFPAQEAITILKDITLQVGRTGIITPVAHLQPINIGGVVVRKASLHNQNEIHRLNIAPNDFVKLQRSGDVIPKVTALHKKESDLTYFQVGDQCPSCKSKLQQEDVFLRCTNVDCSGRCIASLVYMVSNIALDIKGLSEQWIQTLYQNNLVLDLADLYQLSTEKLLSLPRMGPKLASNIMNAIDQKRSLSFVSFLVTLGIPSVGEHRASIIVRSFKTLELLQEASIKELEAIGEIGPKVAQEIFHYFDAESNKQMLERLFNSNFRISYEKKEVESSILEGKTFLFTGVLNSFQRSFAEELVKKNGGRVTSSVSKQVDFIVVGEKPGSKYNKAEKLGLKILSEVEFKHYLQL